MTCDAIVERLPWFANHSLPPEEEAEVRSHLEGCEACRQELAATLQAGRLFDGHPAAETLVALAYGELPAGERRRVEEHLEGCGACRDELALAATSAALETAADAPPPAARRSGLERRWAIAASVAALALLGTTVFLVGQRREVSQRWSSERGRLEQELARLEEPRADHPVLELVPESMHLRGDGAGLPGSRVAAGAPWVTVLLTAPGVAPDGSYRIELRDGDQTVWRSEPTAPDELGGFSVLLPGSRVRGGGHRLVIVPADAPPGAKPLATYRLD